jgi:plastocyanin
MIAMGDMCTNPSPLVAGRLVVEVRPCRRAERRALPGMIRQHIVSFVVVAFMSHHHTHIDRDRDRIDIRRGRSSLRAREFLDGGVSSHSCSHHINPSRHMRSDYLTTRPANRVRRTSVRLLLVITASLAQACGGDGGGYGGPTDPGGGGAPSAAPPVQATPAIQFTPAAVELTAGGTVTFQFGPVEHNVYFDNAPPGAPANITAPSTNQSITRTFPTAGQFRYNCHIHPGMTGIINVR